MENLDHHITLNRKTITSPNLCGEFSDADLRTIGNTVADAYKRDVYSRQDWLRRNNAALDLAMQLQSSKSFPWQGCSNIRFPLVTIAAMQFHARAYPAIINGRDIVKCRIIGGDPTGAQTERANRISTHMSWQLLEQDEDWEAEQDRALLTLPIVGTGFKKTYYSTSRGHNVSEYVMPQNLVLDYWAKTIETCPVKTHIIPMHRNKIHENVRRGIFNDVLDMEWFLSDANPATSNAKMQSDKREGKTVPETSSDTPFTILEQHCLLDLDGDGYAEPYVVTFEENTETVLRIVTRFDREEDIERNNAGEIIQITPWECFTKLPFIPSPDGGIMDVGFGTLLGPLNESVNSAINQLFDAGTMSNTAGGFLGRGAKIRGGAYEFSPFGWNRVDSTGDDLRKNIFPLPVREPSAVMFNLLNLLIEYTERISGSVDMMVGITPGQNTPAETSRNATEQGEKIYSAIFKRIWRALKWEFNKLYKLNGIYLPVKQAYGDAGAFALREDYTQTGAGVVPVADPTISSSGAKMARATLVKQAAAEGGGYNQDAVERMWLSALQVDDMDNLYPGLENMPPPPPDIKIQIQEMKNKAAADKIEFEKWKFIGTMQETMKVNNAKIRELTSKSLLLEAEAESEPQKNQINAFNAAATAMRDQNNLIESQVNRMLEEMNDARERGSNGVGGNVSGMGGTPSNTSPVLPLEEEPTGADGTMG
jgi:chaperonin GroES